jgi:acetylglutamate kinase
LAKEKRLKVWVIEEGMISFLRAAYEAVVNGVVCANGGVKGVVCG